MPCLLFFYSRKNPTHWQVLGQWNTYSLLTARTLFFIYFTNPASCVASGTIEKESLSGFDLLVTYKNTIRCQKVNKETCVSDHTRGLVQDPAVTVSFPLDGEKDVHMVAWTTTPWTLPSNLALCVHPGGTMINYIYGFQLSFGAFSFEVFPPEVLSFGHSFVGYHHQLNLKTDSKRTR